MSGYGIYGTRKKPTAEAVPEAALAAD